MNKNALQLMEDYGANAIGSVLAGIPVEGWPSDGIPEGETVVGSGSLVITKDDDNNVKSYLSPYTFINGVLVQMPEGDLVNAKTYNLVYNSSSNAFVLTAAG